MSDEITDATPSDKVGRKSDGTFAVGNRGGPGRPKNSDSLTAMLRKHGEDPVEANGKTITRAEDLSIKLWEWAQEGDKAAAFYIFDRLEGKPKERIEHSESHVAQITLVTDDGSTGAAETTAVPNNEG